MHARGVESRIARRGTPVDPIEVNLQHPPPPPNIKLTGPAASVSLEVPESHAAAGPVQRPVRRL
jgi:hypothetical protein